VSAGRSRDLVFYKILLVSNLEQPVEQGDPYPCSPTTTNIPSADCGASICLHYRLSILPSSRSQTEEDLRKVAVAKGKILVKNLLEDHARISSVQVREGYIC
jgi:hypothetical protein